MLHVPFENQTSFYMFSEYCITNRKVKDFRQVFPLHPPAMTIYIEHFPVSYCITCPHQFCMTPAIHE